MNGIEYNPNSYAKNIIASEKDVIYIKLTETISMLSKDENTKVGALILDKNGKIVSMGYNGCPSKFGVHWGQNDSIVPHSRENNEIWLTNNYSFLGIKSQKYNINKYPFMLHAEQNALLTASDANRLIGATIYCTHFPCAVCANMISQVGIKSVKVMDNRHGTFEDTIIPTLFIYENMNISLIVFKNEK